MEITTENLDAVFGSVPVTEGQAASINLVTEAFKKLAFDVLTNVPRCAIRTVILRRLLELKMLAVDSIAKGGHI